MGATRITARGAAATVVFALLAAAAAAKCTEAPLGKTNFAAVLNSVSRINVTDPKRPTRPALLYQKACFLLSQTAPCDAAGSACCSSASEYLIKSLTIETDPACASKTNKTPFKTALWNLNSVGNSTKTRLVSSASHKAATKKLPPRFVVNLKSKTVISNSNNELCVDIPDVAANPTCKTIDKVCPGGKCKISITPAKIKSTKTQCCVSGEVPLNECGATGISCTPKAPCIRGTKLTAADVTCTKNGQPLPASAVSTLGTAVCAAGATNLTVVVASAAECASPVIVTFPEFVRPAVKLELIGQATIALAEQVVFDDANKLVYAIGGAKVNILSASALGTPGAPATLPLKGTIDFAVLDKPAGGTPEVTDIVICNGKLAVSVSYKTSTNAQLRGRAWFFAVGEAPLLLGFTTLGFLPDSLTWSADCGTLLASNEAEPNSYGQATSFDPEGSVSVVDTKFFDTASASPCNARVCTTVREAVFTQFNSQAAQLRAKGVRIYGPNATVAQDLEPEYSVFLPGTNFAAVGLQENNAVAILDVAAASIVDIYPLGLKDHSLVTNSLDTNDRDLNSTQRTWNKLFGMYQPDEMASFTHDGANYLVTANEGDSRDYTGYTEEVRVAAANIDAAFPNRTAFRDTNGAGRLTVTTATGDKDADGDLDEVHVLGARSFSVWQVTGGAGGGVTLAYDSANDLEIRTAAPEFTSFYNSDGPGANNPDSRSDNKGPEPEGIALATVTVAAGQPQRRLLFLTLERTSLIAVYDLTNPTGTGPVFQSFAAPPTGLRGPEGISFATYTNGATSFPLVIAAYESGAGGVGLYRVV